jgi:hypothetical protein
VNNKITDFEIRCRLKFQQISIKFTEFLNPDAPLHFARAFMCSGARRAHKGARDATGTVRLRRGRKGRNLAWHSLRSLLLHDQVGKAKERSFRVRFERHMTTKR